MNLLLAQWRKENQRQNSDKKISYSVFFLQFLQMLFLFLYSQLILLFCNQCCFWASNKRKKRRSNRSFLQERRQVTLVKMTVTEFTLLTFFQICQVFRQFFYFYVFSKTCVVNQLCITAFGESVFNRFFVQRKWTIHW